MKSLHYILFFVVSIIYSQQETPLTNAQQLATYKTIPQEQLYIHHNSTLLFSGESIKYKIYCFNSVNNSFSNLSKIAYVILVNENGEHIFEHKVKLYQGKGYGEFFIPVKIASGNYKIVGYTQWMLNTNNHYFSSDISILNPYTVNESIISLDSVVPKEIVVSRVQKTSSILKVVLDEEVYKPRSKVNLVLENLSDDIRGSYSLSVRHKDVIPKSQDISSVDFFKRSNASDLQKNVFPGSSVFLPEMRGELFYGNISSERQDEDNLSLKKDLAASLIGDNDQVYFVSSDDKGNFVFNIPNRTDKSNELLIEVLNANDQKFDVVLNTIPKVKMEGLEFYKFSITDTFKKEILQRSIYNQIENQYFEVKPDSIIQPNSSLPFYGAQDIYTYNLDDYTRFSTIKETLVEVIDGIWSTKDKDGYDNFVVRGYYLGQEHSDYKPLVLIDGVIQLNHHDIINSEAKNITSISYIRDQYFLGNKVFGGIILLKTKDGNYQKTQSLTSGTFFSLPEIQQNNRKPFFQEYTFSDSHARIPDYRNELLWENEITFEEKQKTITFYTSDVTGIFEIRLEGFTSDGIPVSLTKDIQVK